MNVRQRLVPIILKRLHFFRKSSKIDYIDNLFVKLNIENSSLISKNKDATSGNGEATETEAETKK